MAKRKLSPTEQLRRNIKRTVKSMESRGYRIPSEMKEKIETGKYQTLKSIHNKQYSKLYKEATAEIDGDIVSGTEFRKFERKSARSASKKTEQKVTDRIFETARQAQDVLEKARADLYNEGEIIYNNIMELIDTYPTKGSQKLRENLKNEISLFGKEAVLQSMAQSPTQVIASAQQVIFYEDDADSIHSAYQDFADLIRGTIPSAEDAMETGELMDEM